MNQFHHSVNANQQSNNDPFFPLMHDIDCRYTNKVEIFRIASLSIVQYLVVDPGIEVMELPNQVIRLSIFTI